MTALFPTDTWTTYGTAFDPTWSDLQARAAGWLTDKDIDPLTGVSPSFASVMASVGRAEIRPGETWILYTDGITESRSPAGEEFGPERLAVLGRAAAASAGAVIERVFEELNAFTSGGDPADDRTLIVVRRRA